MNQYYSAMKDACPEMLWGEEESKAPHVDCVKCRFFKRHQSIALVGFWLNGEAFHGFCTAQENEIGDSEAVEPCEFFEAK